MIQGLFSKGRTRILIIHRFNSELACPNFLFENRTNIFMIAVGHHIVIKGILPCLLIKLWIHIAVVAPKNRTKKVISVHKASTRAIAFGPAYNAPHTYQQFSSQMLYFQHKVTYLTKTYSAHWLV